MNTDTKQASQQASQSSNQPANSQESNEQLNFLGHSGQYVLVNPDAGTVVWYECPDTAMHDRARRGGILYDLRFANPDDVRDAIRTARRHM